MIPFADPTIPTVDSDGEFAFVPNVTYREEGIADPYYVDGGIWPGLRANYSTPTRTSGWIVLNPTTVSTLDLEFKIWRTARPLDHIDFQLRRPDGSPVYATYRHLPHSDGTIALGHRFDFSALAPTMPGPYGALYDEFSVHATPMDQANHPASGTCRSLNIKWVSVEPSIYEILTMDPLPGLSHDYLCDDLSIGDVGDLFSDVPARTIVISDDGYGVSPSPSSLFITTAGETVRIINGDRVPHRFRTTSTRSLRILGAVGGADRDLDTGLLAPGASVVLTLPTGLPSPYWFNFVDPSSDMSFTLFYRNASCD